MSDDRPAPKAQQLEARDILGLAGIVLLGLGCGFVWAPLGLIVPGGILVYLAIAGVKR